jgi:hypothetical protein
MLVMIRLERNEMLLLIYIDVGEDQNLGIMCWLSCFMFPFFHLSPLSARDFSRHLNSDNTI